MYENLEETTLECNCIYNLRENNLLKLKYTI